MVSKLQEALYPYQREAVAFTREHPRCINGSQMGTGKTIEALALAEELDVASALVVCPTTLVLEWRERVEEWAPNLVHRFDVTNYESLRRTPPTKLYNLIIHDECHKLKNPKAQQTQGAYRLRSPRVVLMSGTPGQNGPQDLWSPLHICNPEQYRSYWKFVNYFCYVIPLPQVHPYARMIAGPRKTTQEELRAVLRKYMIRHEKKDVLPHLPPKVYRDVPVHMNGAQLAKYEQMEKDLFVTLDSGEVITAPSTLAQITRLRQLCLEPNLLSQEKTNTPSAKTAVLLDLLDSLEEPVAVYSDSERYISLLAEYLPDAAQLTGKVSQADRPEERKRFQRGDTKVLLGTIRTAGLGLDITAAHTVIFTDLWWNPDVNEQVEDRTHRIGLEADHLDIITLWMQGTIEDAMRRTLKKKQKWSSQVLALQDTLQELRSMREVSNALHA